jgi:hypothetical protein
MPKLKDKDVREFATIIKALPYLIAALELSTAALDRWKDHDIRTSKGCMYGNDSDQARLACYTAINKVKGE